MQRVHRLVATAFIPNPENKPFVNHKNGIKTDNRAENLEWCTAKENTIHSYQTKLQISIKGSNHYASKLTDEQVLEIRAIGGNLLQIEVAEIYGVCRTVISSILNRKIWKHI